jgi:S1-C subfamily serine protease
VSGLAEIDVRWYVYDKLKKEIAHSERTTGAGSMSKRPGNEVEPIVAEAFKDAAYHLGVSPAFRRIVADDDDKVPSSALPLELLRAASLSGALADRADRVQQATVVIDLGDGHGSGVIVDPRGFILTNQHVVGERRKVLVRLFDGRELIGEVLRWDRARDVALVKIGAAMPALPVRQTEATVSEEVYAIGAPLDPKLSSTLTKGVVSAIRREGSGLEYIQADVDIQAGNSGGPLLDASGNVIGISVAGIREGGVMTGINFFVPIQDALSRLKLKLVDKLTS